MERLQVETAEVRALAMATIGDCCTAQPLSPGKRQELESSLATLANLIRNIQK